MGWDVRLGGVYLYFDTIPCFTYIGVTMGCYFYRNKYPRGKYVEGWVLRDGLCETV